MRNSKLPIRSQTALAAKMAVQQHNQSKAQTLRNDLQALSSYKSNSINRVDAKPTYVGLKELKQVAKNRQTLNLANFGVKNQIKKEPVTNMNYGDHVFNAMDTKHMSSLGNTKPEVARTQSVGRVRPNTSAAESAMRANLKANLANRRSQNLSRAQQMSQLNLKVREMMN